MVGGVRWWWTDMVRSEKACVRVFVSFFLTQNRDSILTKWEINS